MRFHDVNIVTLAALLELTNVQSARIKRMVNGTPLVLNLNDLPQSRLASLRPLSTGRHNCVATFLTRFVAVTAAHCLRTGEDYTLHSANGSVAVVDYIVHHDYDRHARSHDIVLLSTSESWLPEHLEHYAVLPENPFGAAGDCKVYAFEWEPEPTIVSANLRLMSLDECELRLGPAAPDPDSGLMCAVGVDAADTCQGDSGAPVVCRGQIEGLTSHGNGCGIPDLPAVYTCMASHLKWILKHLKRMDHL